MENNDQQNAPVSSKLKTLYLRTKVTLTITLTVPLNTFFLSKTNDQYYPWTLTLQFPFFFGFMGSNCFIIVQLFFQSRPHLFKVSQYSGDLSNIILWFYFRFKLQTHRVLYHTLSSSSHSYHYPILILTLLSSSHPYIIIQFQFLLYYPVLIRIIIQFLFLLYYPVLIRIIIQFLFLLYYPVLIRIIIQFSSVSLSSSHPYHYPILILTLLSSSHPYHYPILILTLLSSFHLYFLFYHILTNISNIWTIWFLTSLGVFTINLFFESNKAQSLEYFFREVSESL